MAIKRIQLVLDTDRDADLLMWLDEQPNRSAAIRSALRAHLTQQDPVLETIRAAVRVELTAALARLQLNQDCSFNLETAEDPELARALDALF
jgi:Arc/MetJ-type ribon-helix-helix transcriptional regulator